MPRQFLLVLDSARHRPTGYAGLVFGDGSDISLPCQTDTDHFLGRLLLPVLGTSSAPCLASCSPSHSSQQINILQLLEFM